jgi:hypothetical protein
VALHVAASLAHDTACCPAQIHYSLCFMLLVAEMLVFLGL